MAPAAEAGTIKLLHQQVGLLHQATLGQPNLPMPAAQQPKRPELLHQATSPLLLDLHHWAATLICHAATTFPCFTSPPEQMSSKTARRLQRAKYPSFNPESINARNDKQPRQGDPCWVSCARQPQPKLTAASRAAEVCRFIYPVFWGFKSFMDGLHGGSAMFPVRSVPCHCFYLISAPNTMHHATNQNKGVAISCTVLLAFTSCSPLSTQYLEYSTAPFNITDGPYGTTFFMTTGFHGLHVLVGTLWLLVATVNYPRCGTGQLCVLSNSACEELARMARFCVLKDAHKPCVGATN